jgi:hypothetical protein
VATRNWRSPAARALTLVAGTPDPIAAMGLLVDDLLTEAEQDTAPVDLALVASFRGITAVTLAEDLPGSALIMAVGSGYQVLLNSRDTTQRRNFSLAHEICHTLFPHFGRAVPLVDTHVGESAGDEEPAPEEEVLCDIGGSRLLLPPRVLGPLVRGLPPGVDALSALAGAFGASLEATAIAVAGLDLWDRIILVCEERGRQVTGRPAAFGQRDVRLRVHMTCLPTWLRGRYFFPKNKSVPEGGPIQQALAERGWTAGRDYIDLPQGRLDLETESVHAPFVRDGVEHHRVVSVVRVV